jgi:hypothetical protein
MDRPGEEVAPGPPEADPGGRRRAAAGWLVLAALLAPALGATWLVPGFVTQDGPAHVYNAHVLRTLVAAPDSPVGRVYEARWTPLPNWAGHLALMGLLGVLSPRDADRVMMSLTLVGFAASILWLRLRVAGPRGSAASAALAALLAMNLTWLFGFYSFLIGCTLFALTLGFWWGRRDRPGPGLATGLAALMVLGYFCHPISLGLTALGVLVLGAATPGPGAGRRLTWTASGVLPTLPLGAYYRSVMGRGGAFAPYWEHLREGFPGGWLAQFAWVDPITLGIKSAFPFVAARSPAFGLLAPLAWLVPGALLVWVSRARRDGTGPGPRRGWAILAVGLLVAGYLAPDTLGPSHGFYLAQRVVLLGLVCVVPVLGGGEGSRAPARLGTLALLVAASVQAAWVVDYARASERIAGPVLRAGPRVPRGARLAALWLDLRGIYRANPLLHAEAMLGVGGDRIVWSNYETAHYYFPVQVRPDVPHPSPLAFEELSILDRPEDAARRAEGWRALLEAEADRVDVLVTRGRDPRIDAITARWYRVTHEDTPDELRIWSRRPSANRAGGAGVTE